MKLIIAEKPLAAGHIAENRKATLKKDGYFEGNGYIVTYAFGHLLELLEPEEYNEKYAAWDFEDLPILPEFKYKVKDDRRKQFAVLKKLLHDSPSEIINACDADREGENIFWLIINACGISDLSNIKRLWFSDLNDEGLNEAFKKLKPIKEYENLYKSAEARQKADWLYGMNLTRLLTTTAKSGLWIFGRVQTPTLMLVCDAFDKHHAFVPKPFWKVRVDLEKDMIPFYALNDTSYQSAELAGAFLKSIPSSLTCTKSESGEATDAAPKLFNLNKLQQECSDKFGMKPHTVLEIAQALYEKHRLTTYPRSDSNYLPETMKDNVNSVIVNVAGNLDLPDQLQAAASKLSGISESNVFNDKKVSSHHAIIPTTATFKKGMLTENELNVYLLIVVRFVQAFMPACRKKVTKIEFAYGEDKFKVTGSVIISEGWRKIDSLLKSEDPDEEKESSDRVLPDVKEGDVLPVKKKEVLERMTQRPALLTDKSLLHLMTTAGKLVEDEELADAMAGAGLGTEATRAEIIRKLYAIPYIGNKGKHVVPTEDGYRLYKVMRGLKIASPELTGLFESNLAKIAEGSYSPKSFLDEAIVMMTEDMAVLKDKTADLEGSGKVKENVGVKCPVCKEGDVLMGAKSFLCSKADWKKESEEFVNNGCQFRINRKLLNKTLTVEIVKELLNTKATKKFFKFKNKEKKSFEASLKLEPDYRVSFVFRNDTIEQIECPRCKKGKIVFFDKAASCNTKREECGFVVFTMIAGKKLSTEQIVELIKNRKTAKIKGFKSKSASTFDAELRLNAKHEVEFAFDK